MKKVLAVFVVLAMTVFSSVVFAADLSVSGGIDIRSRDFSTLSLDKNDTSKNQRDTQERVTLTVDAKSDNANGRISIQNDWDTWGRVEEYQADAQGLKMDPATGDIAAGGPFLKLREAWLSFTVPGLPVLVKGGHQLLQLGQGWFFRSMKYGSDAWLVANQTGGNTLAIVDVKAAEVETAYADDIDAYVILDMLKLDDKNTVGIDVTNIRDRRGLLFGGTEGNLMNIGLNYTGAVGPLNLKAEVDLQSGKVKDAGGAGSDSKFKGNQIVLQGNIPVEPATINFTVARGTGQDATSTDTKKMVTVLDADPHYTFLYEYKLNTAAGAQHTGFANTTAVSVGASVAASKSVTLGVDLWMLQATEKVANVKTGTGTTSDIGQEIDAKINWQLYDNLSWNWTIGYFKPGDGMGSDNATGVQGVLALKF